VVTELGKESIPLTVPAAWGANEILNITCCPGERVIGIAGPFHLKLDPARFGWDTVTAVFPELLKASDWVELLPT